MRSIPVRFEKPLVLRGDGTGRRRPARPIGDVYDALAALHRSGLSAYGLSRRGVRREWSRAARALMVAQLDPTPKRLAQAREALAVLARAAGLLDEPGHGRSSESAARP